MQCLPHLLPEALLSTVDGCGLLVADPSGQAVGLPVNRVIIQGKGMVPGAGAFPGSPSELKGLFIL